VAGHARRRAGRGDVRPEPGPHAGGRGHHGDRHRGHRLSLHRHRHPHPLHTARRPLPAPTARARLVRRSRGTRQRPGRRRAGRPCLGHRGTHLEQRRPGHPAPAPAHHPAPLARPAELRQRPARAPHLRAEDR
jgi:hypothetical protein